MQPDPYAAHRKYIMKQNSFISRFLKHEHGNVLMLTGLAIIIMFATGGAAIDFGRQQLVRMKLQQASDAAALAAASMPENASQQERFNAALRYYNLNYPPEYLGIARPAPNITIGNSISVRANANIRSNFVRNVGVETLEARGRTVVNLNTTTTQTDYDVILAMDNSGSMYEADVGNNGIAEVPASARVAARRIGHEACVRWATARGYNRGQINNYCVSPDSGAYRPNDPHDFERYDSDADYGMNGATRLNSLRGAALNLVQNLLGSSPGNRVAAITWSNELRASEALTNNRATIDQLLNNMVAFGGTNSSLGLQQSLTYSAASRPNAVRAVVLLTDGENTVPSRQAADAASLSLCNQLKNSGVLVYTIAFGRVVTNDAVARSFLSNCATSHPQGNEGRYFFPAPDSASLQQAFAAITTSIRKIRISE